MCSVDRSYDFLLSSNNSLELSTEPGAVQSTYTAVRFSGATSDVLQNSDKRLREFCVA